MFTFKPLVILMFLLLSLAPSQTRAWDDKKTHPTLTEIAVNKATGLKDALKSHLGFEEKLNKKFYNDHDKYTITEWLQEGSHLEDVPVCRAANHFHNPWELWKDSMLTDPPRNGGSSHHA
jgi:hypothetical protein